MFYLPRICEHCLNPSCVASLPVGRDVQARRGRHRARRPGPVPRLAHVRHRLPVQEGLLQPPHRQGREVHLCYPRIEVGHADGVLGDLRRAAALHRPVPLRRRRVAGGRVGRGRARPARGAARPASSTRTTPRCIAAARARRHPRGLDRRRAASRRSTRWPRSTASRCRCTRSTARCRWSGTSRRCRRSSTPCARPATTPRTRTTCSAPSTRCGSRSSTSPSCSPPATPTPVQAVAAQARRDALLHARRQPRRASPTRRSPAVGRHGRGVDLRDVPAAGHRQVRRPVRHPQGARGDRTRPGGTGLRGRLRGRGHDHRLRSLRGGLRPTGARRGGDVPRAQAAADHRGDHPRRGARVNLLNWDGLGGKDE